MTSVSTRYSTRSTTNNIDNAKAKVKNAAKADIKATVALRFSLLNPTSPIRDVNRHLVRMAIERPHLLYKREMIQAIFIFYGRRLINDLLTIEGGVRHVYNLALFGGDMQRSKVMDVFLSLLPDEVRAVWESDSFDTDVLDIVHQFDEIAWSMSGLSKKGLSKSSKKGSKKGLSKSSKKGSKKGLSKSSKKGSKKGLSKSSKKSSSKHLDEVSEELKDQAIMGIISSYRRRLLEPIMLMMWQ